MKFIATVYNQDQAPIKIKVSAINQHEAIKKAEIMHYQVLSIHSADGVLFNLKKKFPLDIFTEQFLSLQKAGLDLTQSIKVLANRENLEQRAVLDDVILHLESGKTFSEALENNLDAFPPLYIATVRSAEHTSNLVEAMERYIKYHRQVATIKRKIISAMTYPLVLLLLGIAVLFFLLIFVVPNFSLIYGDIKTDLSFATRLLLGMGSFLQEYLYFIKGGIFLLILSGIYISLNQALRQKVLIFILKSKLLRNKVRMHQLSGFYRTFGMLIDGGLPIVQAFKTSSELLTVFSKELIENCINDIAQGESPSQSFKKAELGDDIAFYLIEAGEKSGNLAHMMTKISDFYDTDMDIEIERFTKLFEPILMIIIGAMIGAVILIMYIPIFNLTEGLQQ